MDQIQLFLEGKKPFKEVYRGFGPVKFIVSLLKSDKILLLKRIRSAIHARTYSIYKEQRYTILIPYLQISDAIDIIFFRRNLIPLHRKLKEHLKLQKNSWNSFIYSGGYFYQGWSDIGIRGIRETNQRYSDYELDDILSKEKEVLDIGCNNGFLALKVAQNSGHVDALELNPHLINIGKDVKEFLAIDNIDFIVDDFQKLESRKSYDVVLSLANHLTGDGNLPLTFRDYMEKIHCLLKDDGLVAFESHVYEANDPKFRESLESMTDLFRIENEKRIAQYKIIYIGDRLFFILRKKGKDKS